MYFCDAAFAPRSAKRENDADLDDVSTSLLLGMQEVLVKYFDQECTDPDRHLVRALYQPLFGALSKMEGF